MDWLTHHAGLIGLLFFFTLFCGIAVWLYRPGMKTRIESLGYIPLKEDSHDAP